MSTLFRNAMSRRTLLRGSGAAIALPLLEAMLPKAVRADESSEVAPRRMAVLFMPNGVHPKMWTPEKTGRDFEMSPTLEPLADLKEHLIVLTNLWNQFSNTGDGHYVKTAGLLTSMTINKTVGIDLNSNGVSMDQLIAQKIGHETPLPSMELGIEPVRTGVDKAVGYTRVYGAHIAWKSPTMPLAKEIDPRLAFDRLNQAIQPAGEDNARDRSMLDIVLEDARRIRDKVGSNDRRKVDEYLESVRSVEQRLDRLSDSRTNKWSPRATLDSAARPEAIPEEHADRVRLMLDIIAMAFQTDSTRVCTFMFGNSVSDISFSFLDGVKGTHHGLSHHEDKADKLEQYQLINKWHIEQYAYFLRKLQSMAEGDKNLLDNSMVMFASDFRDGQRHDPHNVPVLLAGSCGGRLATGQHLVYPKDSPLSNLYLSMMQAMDAPTDRFADSTGPLKEILA